MAFDADQFVQAMQPPSITIDGTTYTGKPLGYLTARAFKARFQAPQDFEGYGDLVTEFCDALGIPADKVLALPFEAVVAGVMDFFGLRPGAQPTSPSPTRGPSSAAAPSPRRRGTRA